MRPDYSNIAFDRNLVCKINGTEEPEGSGWMSSEQIPILPVFGPEHRKNLEHLDFVSGIPPFLRGPYGSMYAVRPWTIRQYAGFSTAEESNAF